jgi:flagellar basal-body rod protein FlgF/flagellar basal-body rod protein FlgG
VQTPRGERYTRNGALQINGQGELVTSEGYKVVGDNGPIVFQPGDTNTAISREGTITVRDGTNVAEARRGKLRLVTFAQPERLQKDGASMFAAPAGLNAEAATTAGVIQGSIEKSNVSGVAEMTRMIDVTRAYQALAGMLQSQGDLRRTAIEKLAEVPA